MPDLVCMDQCGKPGFTSLSSFKRHLDVCAKRISAYFNDQLIESDMQILRFTSLNMDDDYDNDNKEIMPMQDYDEFIFQSSIQTMNWMCMWITILIRIKMMTVTTKHYMRGQKKIQMTMKSNLTLMSSLENTLDVHQNGSEKSLKKII